MRCPNCGEKEIKTTDSRSHDDYIRRRKECLECNTRFTTYEEIPYEHLKGVNKEEDKRFL